MLPFISNSLHDCNALRVPHGDKSGDGPSTVEREREREREQLPLGTSNRPLLYVKIKRVPSKHHIHTKTPLNYMISLFHPPPGAAILRKCLKTIGEEVIHQGLKWIQMTKDISQTVEQRVSLVEGQLKKRHVKMLQVDLHTCSRRNWVHIFPADSHSIFSLHSREGHPGCVSDTMGFLYS